MPGTNPWPATVYCEPFATGFGVTQQVSDPVRLTGPPPLSALGAAAAGEIISAPTTSSARMDIFILTSFDLSMCSPSSASLAQTQTRREVGVQRANPKP